MDDIKNLLKAVPPPLNLPEQTLTELAREKVKTFANPAERLTYARAIVQKWLDDAISEDPVIRRDARRDLMDRLEGKAKEHVSHDVTGQVQHVISAIPLTEEAWAQTYGPKRLPDGH